MRPSLATLACFLPAALCANSAPSLLKVLTWNVNSDRKVESGFATATHEAWKFSNRLNAIVDQVISVDPDVAMIQELDSSSMVSLGDAMKERGYDVLTQAYCSHERAFVLMTIFKPNRFVELNHEGRYFTQTPNIPTPRSGDASITLEQETVIKNNNFGELFERSTLIVVLQEKLSGRQVLVFNIHFGILTDYRLKSAELFRSFVLEFKEKSVLDTNSEPAIIAGGDFNAFPDDPRTVDMMNAIKSAGLVDITNDAVHQYGENLIKLETCPTFCFYPYDTGMTPPGSKKKEILTSLMADFEQEHFTITEKRTMLNNFFKEHGTVLGGHLDYIFVSGLTGFRNTRVLMTPFNNSANFEVNPADNFASLKAFVHGSNADNIPAFPSDHLPISCECEV
jgi:endonuclease/exonuclease/phosphatase family metal-dependent hydrolase